MPSISNPVANPQMQLRGGGGTRETKKGTLAQYFSFLPNEPKGPQPQEASFGCNSKNTATGHRGGIHCRLNNSSEDQVYDHIDINQEGYTDAEGNSNAPIEILSSDSEEEESKSATTEHNTNKNIIAEALHGDHFTSSRPEHSVTSHAEQQLAYGKGNSQQESGTQAVSHNDMEFGKRLGPEKVIEIHDCDDTDNEEHIVKSSKQLVVKNRRLDFELPPLQEDENNWTNKTSISGEGIDVVDDPMITPGTGNLFAAFAFGGGAEVAFDASSLAGASSTAMDLSMGEKLKANANIKESLKAYPTRTKKRKSCKSTQREDECPWEERSEGYKLQCLKKWHSFADTKASIEIQRFQILVAARLHAQAHESVVRDAMASLPQKLKHHPLSHENDTRKQIKDRVVDASTQSEIVHDGDASDAKGVSSALNVNTMSQLDPAVLASWIPSVHFGTSKAKQIVQASHDLINKFRGQVPESTRDLQQLTGIGPSLAAILSRVNTRASFASVALD